MARGSEAARAATRKAVDKRLKFAEKTFAKARSRDSLQAAGKLTEVVDGTRRIVDQPPARHAHAGARARTRRSPACSASTRRPSKTTGVELLDRFEVVDMARKVVGVGSVGTRCVIVLLLGRDADDPLFLQVKEAGPSVLEPYLGRSRFAHGGHRVVAGQRLMQAASDIFLGWMTGKPGGRQFYWRQLRDMKGSIEVELLKAPGLEILARCAAGRWPAATPARATASPSPRTSA